MKKAILATIVALFAFLAVMTVVSAGTGLTNDFDVTVDGVDVTGTSISGIEAGETIPVKVVFTATEDAEDVKLKVWIDGYRAEIMDKTDRFDLVDGSTYSKKLSLDLPSDIDPTEDYELIVRISDKTKSYEEEYTLRLQRESYNAEVLSIETDSEAVAGSVIGVDVVVKNTGMRELEDVFVVASIPDLGIQRKVYFGDIDPQDDCDYDDDRECGRDDSSYRRIYLTIPRDAKSGTYSLEVEAYNLDFSETAKANVVISGGEASSDILSGATSKSIAIGQEVTYDLVIVNAADEMKVYTLTPEDAEGLLVDVEPIVTVASDSSKTVRVRVKATESATEGTHTVAINVESDGELVKRALFTANVEKESVTSSIVVLTIILAIVFIVLLIILIVLLTRRPVAMPEAEETSYY